MFFLIPLLIFVGCNGVENAKFLVPFEISFADTNQFTFTINNLEHFIESTSTFFEIEKDNITISFIKEISSPNNYIDAGFTVSVNTFDDEEVIRNKDISLYRSYLMNMNNLPQIIGIELKYTSCSNGKYSTFYNYNIECKWLCDHLSIYNNKTNECQSISNTSSTMQITETNTSRFIYIGYVSSILITIFFYIIFTLNIYVKNNSKLLKSKNKKNNNKKNKYKMDQGPPPILEKKTSVYFYHDIENEEEEEQNKEEIKANDEKSNENNENEKNIALSVKSTRSNSIHSIDNKDRLSVLQSPTTQNEELFRETTLGPLENIECNEKLKKMKSMIIEQGRLEQFKLMDSLDEFRKNVENEICLQNKEETEKLTSEYLIKRQSVIDENEINQIEKEKKLTQLKAKYDSTKIKLEKEGNDEQKHKINDYKNNIKDQLQNIKNKTSQKLRNLIEDDDDQ